MLAKIVKGHARHLGLSLAAVLLVSGCASGLSRDECQSADWKTIGYEDGIKGWSQTRISRHRESCAKHGVTLDLAAYRAGWQEGVQAYCKPGNAYRQGRSGQKYLGVCPEQMEPRFREAYSHGRELYLLESGVQRLTRTLNHKRQRLDEIEVEMRDTGIELVAHGVTTEHRVILLDELRKLEQERSEIRAQIPYLEDELAEQEHRLTVVSESHSY